MSMNFHYINESYRDYDYGHANPHLCENGSGYYTKNDFGISYTWDGLPVRPRIANESDFIVAGTQILFGIFGTFINTCCAWVLLKNSLLSWAVKYYLLIDCYCRFNEAIVEFYKAYCVLSWQCVSTTGPFGVPGILINRIVTASNMGMIYSMQYLGNGLCVNRLFAVFWNGKYYRHIEALALPHALILWAIPLIVFYYEIGDRVSEDGTFRCYGGWYWTPLEYCTSLFYTWNWTVEWLSWNWDKLMYGVTVVTLSIDVATLCKVHSLKNHSNALNKANLRLSIMLVTTHFITVCFLFSDYIVNYVFVAGLPIYFFVLIECVPFVDHSILSFIIILFNLQPKKKPNMSLVTNAFTTTTVLNSSPRHQSLSEHRNSSTHVKVS